ncbi:MAG: hypothetical protein N2F24_12815, partial [Deltaproteobacteria bacterium]
WPRNAPKSNARARVRRIGVQNSVEQSGVRSIAPVAAPQQGTTRPVHLCIIPTYVLGRGPATTPKRFTARD